jgi:hypothetical protein
MRPTPLISAAIVLALVAPAVAQDEWDEFASKDDGFSVNFPGPPKVEQTTWKTQYGYTAPARIYRASHGQERYSVTVVDYRVLEQQGIERAKQCPPGAEPCRGNQVGSLGAGYWRMDVRGALIYASLKFIQRDAKVTDFNWQIQELVEGLHIQLTNNADQSRTFGYITMHDNRLYIFEGTTPKGSAEPALFQGSVGFVDKDGNRIRYQRIYSNAWHGLGDYPAPPLAGRGGGAAGAGGGAAGAGGGRGTGRGTPQN